MRSHIVETMGLTMNFTLQQVIDLCELTEHDALMTLGQMIKIGLVDFERGVGLPWNAPQQTYHDHD